MRPPSARGYPLALGLLLCTAPLAGGQERRCPPAPGDGGGVSAVFVLVAHVATEFQGNVLAASAQSVRRWHPTAVIITVDNASPSPVNFSAMSDSGWFAERVEVLREATSGYEFGAYAAAIRRIRACPERYEGAAHYVFMQSLLLLLRAVPFASLACAVTHFGVMWPASEVRRLKHSPQTTGLEFYKEYSSTFFEKAGWNQSASEADWGTLHTSFCATPEGLRTVERSGLLTHRRTDTKDKTLAMETFLGVALGRLGFGAHSCGLDLAARCPAQYDPSCAVYMKFHSNMANRGDTSALLGLFRALDANADGRVPLAAMRRAALAGATARRRVAEACFGAQWPACAPASPARDSAQWQAIARSATWALSDGGAWRTVRRLIGTSLGETSLWGPLEPSGGAAEGGAAGEHLTFAEWLLEYFEPRGALVPALAAACRDAGPGTLGLLTDAVQPPKGWVERAGVGFMNHTASWGPNMHQWSAPRALHGVMTRSRSGWASCATDAEQPASCDARCRAAGYCCLGTSGWRGHPSCSAGCELGRHSPSFAHCVSSCTAANWKCDYSENFPDGSRVDLFNCGVKGQFGSNCPGCAGDTFRPGLPACVSGCSWAVQARLDFRTNR